MSAGRYAARSLVIALAVAWAFTSSLHAQEDRPGGHRKWLYGGAAAVLVGVPAILSADFSIGACRSSSCFAPIAAAGAFTVGFLLGQELDERAALQFVPGPEREPDFRTVSLPLTPGRVVPYRGGTLAFGPSGVAMIEADAGRTTLLGARGALAAAALPDREAAIVATASELYGFALQAAAPGARRIFGEGGRFLEPLPDGRLILGGAGGLRLLRPVGEGPGLGVSEEMRAPTRAPPTHGVTDLDGRVVWTLTGGRLASRSTDTLDELGALELDGRLRSLSVDGPLAVAAAGPDGLFIVDVSDPSVPRLVARFAEVRDVADAAVRGRRAYVAGDRQGLVVLDLSQPHTPIVTGVFRNLGRPRHVVPVESGLYVLDGESAELLHVPADALVWSP